ncbi:GntR family transcriptional regulator [Variovorax sp. YR216]|uniref:GntR family transcriptional regulator n=1 Tax=Variovorax sp. YR216 TaxID=1882828 RepID=UPI000B850145|nr:GntR family transcriptional regulator [Variovorax sp. YR216]
MNALPDLGVVLRRDVKIGGKPRGIPHRARRQRGLIHDQRLRADDSLPPERDLAEQFGVSRNSVRQALRSLEEQVLH